MLLTATPFATSEANINNQLRMLPHTSRTAPAEGHQTQLPLFERYPWHVKDVRDLIESDVATVINAPFVARVFGRHDADLNRVPGLPEWRAQVLPVGLPRARPDSAPPP